MLLQLDRRSGLDAAKVPQPSSLHRDQDAIDVSGLSVPVPCFVLPKPLASPAWWGASQSWWPVSCTVQPLARAQRWMVFIEHIAPWQGPIEMVLYRLSSSILSYPSAIAVSTSSSVTSSQ